MPDTPALAHTLPYKTKRSILHYYHTLCPTGSCLTQGAVAHFVLYQYITEYAQETTSDTETGTDTLCCTNMPHTDCTLKYLHTHVLSHKTMLAKFVHNVLQNNQKNLGRSHVSRVKYIRCVNQIYVLRIDKSLV